MFGRGVPMFGGLGGVTSTAWPQASPFTTDLAKAKQLLSEAGMADGFETTLSFDLGVAVTSSSVAMPMSRLWRQTFCSRNGHGPARPA